MDGHPRHLPMAAREELGRGDGSPKQAPDVGRGAPAEHRIVSARLDRGEISCLDARRVVPDSIDPAMNWNQGSSPLPRLICSGVIPAARSSALVTTPWALLASSASTRSTCLPIAHRPK